MMMDFIAQYGLFAFKTFTLVIAILVVFAGIVSIGRKTKPKLSIRFVNEEIEALKHRLIKETQGKKPKKVKKSKSNKKKDESTSCVFVLDFDGDIKASEVEQLREEITAVLTIATPADEIVVRLDSPGGVVNGYGLAAAQLQRIREKKIPLTVCVDKMAASGGYLMSVVANKIIASPFAIIGSIGVVGQMPNFHRWLQKNDIDVELLTAGEYKRTLTLLGENTDKGRKKFQEDLEKIHTTFRNYILNNRDTVDIDLVATGEHWLGQDAKLLGLVDELGTSDDYLMARIETAKVYEISMQRKPSLAAKLLKPAMKILNTSKAPLG